MRTNTTILHLSYGLFAGVAGAFYVFAALFSHTLSMRSLLMPLAIMVFLGASISFILGRVARQLPWGFLAGYVFPCIALTLAILAMNHFNTSDARLLVLPVLLAFASSLLGGILGQMHVW